MIDSSTTLLHGLLICLPFSAFAVGSFWLWPRVWLHSLPRDIQQRAGPKTEAEVRQTRYLLLIFPWLPVVSAWYAAARTGVDLSFGGAVVHIYGIWILVHLWDFAIIDCIHASLIDPDHPPIPGTEGASGWRDYGFHFRAFLKAVVMSALLVVPLSALAAVLA